MVNEYRANGIRAPLASPYSPSPKGDATRTGILRRALASPNVRRGDAARSKIPVGVQVGEPQGRSGLATQAKSAFPAERYANAD